MIKFEVVWRSHCGKYVLLWISFQAKSFCGKMTIMECGWVWKCWREAPWEIRETLRWCPLSLVLSHLIQAKRGKYFRFLIINPGGILHFTINSIPSNSIYEYFFWSQFSKRWAYCVLETRFESSLHQSSHNCPLRSSYIDSLTYHVGNLSV